MPNENLTWFVSTKPFDRLTPTTSERTFSDTIGMAKRAILFAPCPRLECHKTCGIIQASIIKSEQQRHWQISQHISCWDANLLFPLRISCWSFVPTRLSYGGNWMCDKVVRRCFRNRPLIANEILGFSCRKQFLTWSMVVLNCVKGPRNSDVP